MSQKEYRIIAKTESKKRLTTSVPVRKEKPNVRPGEDQQNRKSKKREKQIADVKMKKTERKTIGDTKKIVFEKEVAVSLSVFEKK